MKAGGEAREDGYKKGRESLDQTRITITLHCHCRPAGESGQGRQAREGKGRVLSSEPIKPSPVHGQLANGRPSHG